MYNVSLLIALKVLFSTVLFSTNTGHLTQRADLLGKIEGRRKKGWVTEDEMVRCHH